MELELVWVRELPDGRKNYFAVNDKHYDAMLAGEIQGWEWDRVGTVSISEEILNEQGYFYKDD